MLLRYASSIIKFLPLLFIGFAITVLQSVAYAGDDSNPKNPLTMSQVIANSKPDDWRKLDINNTLYMDLPHGRVVMELAVDFAPEHVANVKTLVRQNYFDGAAITRSQDNYVAQWGNTRDDKTLGKAKANLQPEFDRSWTHKAFFKLTDGDVYAPEVGFFNSMPMAYDPVKGRAWLSHCYGMLGVGRDNAPDSGNGAELYVVTGHSPRHLDLNVTLIGRVIAGIDLLSSLPRGTGPLGFYEKPEQQIPIHKIQLAAELSEDQRIHYELLRSDSESFAQLVKARRHRHEDWFVSPTGRVSLCNVPIPVRKVP